MEPALAVALLWLVFGGSREGGDTVPTVFQQRNVPEAIRSLSTLASPDYVDLFTVTTSEAVCASPEQWARAAVEAAGLGGQFVWRVLCGLRLERRPDECRYRPVVANERGDGQVPVVDHENELGGHEP